jgi:hypothetical protein
MDEWSDYYLSTTRDQDLVYGGTQCFENTREFGLKHLAPIADQFASLSSEPFARTRARASLDAQRRTECQYAGTFR